MALPAIPLIVTAIGRVALPTIAKFIARSGTKEAVKKYGSRAVQQVKKQEKIGQRVSESQARGKATEQAASAAAKPKPKIKAKPQTTTVGGNASTATGGRSAAVKPRVKPKTKPAEKPLTATQADRIGGGATGGRSAAARKPLNKKAIGAGAAVATAPAVITSMTDTEKKQSAPSGSSYTIKSGDTLSAIAKRMGVRLSEIKAANPSIQDLNKIRPGQKIKVPKASIKGTGKSVYEGMSKSEMEKLAMKKKKQKGSKTGNPGDNSGRSPSFSKGGMYANCGASMKPAQKSSRGN